MFYNPDANKLKKTDLIKRRITGLTSYYEFPDKTKYPELLPINKMYRGIINISWNGSHYESLKN